MLVRCASRHPASLTSQKVVTKGMKGFSTKAQFGNKARKAFFPSTPSFQGRKETPVAAVEAKSSTIDGSVF